MEKMLPFWRTDVSSAASPGWATRGRVPPSLSASTSIAKTRKVLVIVPILFTTVLMAGNLSIITCAITRRKCSCPSRKLRCATCPIVSNDPGTSTSLGSTFRSASSYVKCSYSSTILCFTSSQPSPASTARHSSGSSSTDSPSLMYFSEMISLSRSSFPGDFPASLLPLGASTTFCCRVLFRRSFLMDLSAAAICFGGRRIARSDSSSRT
mmetsp:Transcript_29881/g.71083  ORF Transcript_29881/g.71083 Transcript_29881/m.71083 type:complete len:210 (-) Transcript_29881:123-752(-)